MYYFFYFYSLLKRQKMPTKIKKYAKEDNFKLHKNISMQNKSD